ncbi:MAG: VanW family protein [Ornithinimicrobium sp.]
MAKNSQPGEPVPSEHTRGEWRGIIIRLTVAVLVLGGAYVGLAYYLGDRVPAGTTVEGVDIGTLSQSGATSVLEDKLSDLATEPVVVEVGEESARLEPDQAGLALDLDETLDGVAGVSLDPRTMWAHLTGNGRETTLDTAVDSAQLEQALAQAGEEVNRAPLKAAVVLTQGEVKTTLPEDGVDLDVEASAEEIADQWPGQSVYEAPTTPVPAALNAEQVESFVAEYAEPALSEPVVISVEGEDAKATITPNQLSRLLTVEQVGDAEGEASLQLILDTDGLSNLVGGALVGVEQAPRDATVRLNDLGQPEIVEAMVGKEIDEAAALSGVREILRANELPAEDDGDGADQEQSTADADDATASVGGPDSAQRTSTDESDTVSVQDRTVLVTTTQVRPDIGNAEAREWEVDAVMAEFTSQFPTGADNAGRTENIRVGLRYVNGSVIMPGEQFSLADALAPISRDRGYVEAGVISAGRLVNGIGGGLSQVSTTLLNTAWFAGVELNEFTPHQYYISRYPEGREATISVGTIDNVWTNDTSSPIIIQTFIAGDDIVMRFYGDRQYTVETRTGARTNITQPESKTDDSVDCLTQGPVEGFTITVARDLISSGDVVRTDEYTTTYQPSAGVTCTNTSG